MLGESFSYTTVAYSDLTVPQSAIPADGVVTATVRLTNTGTRHTRETVQAYVNDLTTTVTWAEQELEAFTQVEVALGETIAGPDRDPRIPVRAGHPRRSPRRRAGRLRAPRRPQLAARGPHCCPNHHFALRLAERCSFGAAQSSRARESEDSNRNKSDETDALIIARLVTELRCYLPEGAEPPWTRLRHRGARLGNGVGHGGAGADRPGHRPRCRQQVRDLLERAWPAGWRPPRAAARQELGGRNDGATGPVEASGDLTLIHRRGWSRFAAAGAVRRAATAAATATRRSWGRLRRRGRPAAGDHRGGQPAGRAPVAARGLSRRQSPACLTSAPALENRVGSPVSARMAAAATGQPGDAGRQRPTRGQPPEISPAT